MSALHCTVNIKGTLFEMCVLCWAVCQSFVNLPMSKALGKAGATQEEEKGKERETGMDTAAQKKLEEQQKRQEAVLHKDRVCLLR